MRAMEEQLAPKILYTSLTCLLIVLTVALLQPANRAAQTDDLSKIATQLTDQRWSVRSDAFYALLRQGEKLSSSTSTNSVPDYVANVLKGTPDKAEAIKIALFKALEMENAAVNAQTVEFRRSGRKKTLSEQQVNYYGDLISVVSSLKDLRAVDGLMGAIATGGMATGSLAEFGSPVLDRVIAKAKRGILNERLGAIDVLSRMLEAGTFANDPSAKSKIVATLEKASRDRNPLVRLNSNQGLKSNQ